MARQVVLDAGPLGMITHPRPNREIADWFKQMLRSRIPLHVAEIADYERGTPFPFCGRLELAGHHRRRSALTLAKGINGRTRCYSCTVGSRSIFSRIRAWPGFSVINRPHQALSRVSYISVFSSSPVAISRRTRGRL